MKVFKYAFVLTLIAFAAMSCTDENVKPLGDDTDPIIVPPPPPKSGT